MRTREYRVWFSINVELPENEDPTKAYRAAKFNLMNNKVNRYTDHVYELEHIEEIVWYRYHDTAIRRWSKDGHETNIDTQIAGRYKYWREREQQDQKQKQEQDKLKQTTQEQMESGVAP